MLTIIDDVIVETTQLSSPIIVDDVILPAFYREAALTGTSSFEVSPTKKQFFEILVEAVSEVTVERTIARNRTVSFIGTSGFETTNVAEFNREAVFSGQASMQLNGVRFIRGRAVTFTGVSLGQADRRIIYAKKKGNYLLGSDGKNRMVAI